MGFGAAGARVKDNNRVSPIIRPPKQLGKLGLRQLLANCSHFRGRFVERVVVLLVLGNFQKKTGFFEIRAMLFPGADSTLNRRLLSQNALRFFPVVPKIRLPGDFVQFVDALLLALDVKDASAKALLALRVG